MEGTFHYMLIANQALVHKKLPAYLKDTGLTIGQPKVLEYLSEHDGSNQTEIARIFSRVLHFLPGVLFGDRREEEPEDIREGGDGFVVAIGREYGSGGRGMPFTTMRSSAAPRARWGTAQSSWRSRRRA